MDQNSHIKQHNGIERNEFNCLEQCEFTGSSLIIKKCLTGNSAKDAKWGVNSLAFDPARGLKAAIIHLRNWQSATHRRNRDKYRETCVRSIDRKTCFYCCCDGRRNEDLSSLDREICGYHPVRPRRSNVEHLSRWILPWQVDPDRSGGCDVATCSEMLFSALRFVFISSKTPPSTCTRAFFKLLM